MLKRIVFIIFIITHLQSVVSAQRNIETARDHINQTFDSVIFLAESLSRDSIFYSTVERLKSSIYSYKSKFGIDDYITDRSLLVARELVLTNPLESIKIFEENIAYAIENQRYDVLNSNYHELGNLYLMYDNNDRAVHYYTLSSNYYLQKKDWPAYAYALVDIGNLYYGNHHQNMAVFYYSKAKKLFLSHLKSDDLYYALGVYYNNMGLLFHQKQEFDSALTNFRTALSYRIKLNRNNLFPQSYVYIARTFMNLEQNDSADYYYCKAIELDILLKQEEDLVVTYLDYGDFLTIIGQMDKALNIYRKATELIYKNKLFPYLVQSAYQSALIYHQRQVFDSTLMMLNLTDSLATLYDQKKYMELSLVGLITLYSHKGDYKKVAELNHRYTDLLKNLNKNEILKKEVELQSIERKREEDINEQNNLRNKRIITFQTIALVLAVLLVFVAVYTAFRFKRQKRQLQETVAHRDLTYSIIAHDLKSPLSGIYGGLQMVVSDDEIDSDTSQKIIQASFTSLKSTITLLENLQEWASYQTEAKKQDIRIINIEDVVLPVINLLSEVALLKNISFRYQLQGKVKVDLLMANSIFRNLISNAIKFSNPGSEILIDTYANDSFLEIRIQDFGRGMDKETIKKIEKSNITFTTLGTANERGTGLGLTIVKDFLKKNHGKLKITSRLGEGATFTVFLPSGS